MTRDSGNYSRLNTHWVPYAVHRGGCLELYYCNMVEWFWWDSSLISTTNWFPSVLWHCWFGHQACKNRPWMTYYVSSGTLNPTHWLTLNTGWATMQRHRSFITNGSSVSLYPSGHWPIRACLASCLHSLQSCTSQLANYLHSDNDNTTTRCDCLCGGPTPVLNPLKAQWHQKVTFQSVPCHPNLVYTVSQKNAHIYIFLITRLNVNQF